jgi:hypothetical protein
MWPSYLLVPFFAIPHVLAAVQEVWWNLTYVQDVNPDGLAARRVIGVNGTWPPPPIDVQAVDTLLVHATNSLETVSSLHHHGMFFNASSWNDGAVGVSEWYNSHPILFHLPDKHTLFQRYSPRRPIHIQYRHQRLRPDGHVLGPRTRLWPIR